MSCSLIIPFTFHFVAGEAASTTSAGSGATTPVLNISEAEKKRLIAEEAARMEALKVRKCSGNL